MLKKVNYVLGVATILALIILPFKYFGLVTDIPIFVEYWPVLIVLMGVISLICKKKATLQNLLAILAGLILLLSKLGIVIY